MVDEPSGTQPPDEPAPRSRPSLRQRVAHVRDRTVELEGKAAERFEQERRRRTWVEIGWQAWLRMRQRGGPLLSGGLAYRLFLFMIPAALLVVAVIGAFVDISGETPEQALVREMATRLFALIEVFGRRSWITLVLNTSFKVAGEPIV